MAGKKKVTLKRKPERIRASYDLARTTDENRRHWANADAFSADAAASPEKRRIIRNRSRYEVANNSVLDGMLQTLANDVIGTGPRLQMLTDNDRLNRTIEREFAKWSKACGLAAKFRTLRFAKAQDGEGCAVLTTNPRLNHPVKLDIKPIEAEQLADPYLTSLLNDSVDGMDLDEDGNPAEYHVLKRHPGGNAASLDQKVQRVKPAFFIHWFTQKRPGMHRGLPDIMPALLVMPKLRRYQAAVADAAESVANHSLIAKTDAPSGGEAAAMEPYQTMEIDRNLLTFLPEGWDMGQVKAEQPTDSYAEYRGEVINEAARCLNMPYNVAAGNSSEYNYASGRLDHQTYFKSISVERSHVEIIGLDKILDQWIPEAALVFGLVLPPDLPHQWFWDEDEHVDPEKEANAEDTKLRNGSTTYAAVYARRGKDWETEFRQRAKEEALKRELKLSFESAKPKPTSTDDEQAPEGQEKDNANDEDQNAEAA